jgi:GNAT superfamily N-acetyltransferase
MMLLNFKGEIMYKIKMLSSVSDEMKKKIIEMDNRAFPPQDWGTLEEAETLYSSKNDSIILLLKDNTPVGFVSVFAFNRIYLENAIQNDHAFYQTLTSDNLLDKNQNAVYCYCFLLLPEYRNQGLIYALYLGLKEWLVQRNLSEYPIYAEAVSDDGIACLNRIGFKQIHSYSDKGKVQMVSYEEVLRNIDAQIKDRQWIFDMPIEIDNII